VYTAASARADLSSRADLDARGPSSRAIEAAIANGALRRVHHGWYVECPVWDAAYSEKRHLLRVVAAHAQQRCSDAVASHTSAVVLHGLPLFRLTPRRVHVSGAALGGHVSKPDVARHRIAVPEEDQAVIDGIPCTSLARTVADMVRLASPEAGLSIADAALRLAAWDDTELTYDEGIAEHLRSQIRSRMERNARGRGIRRGRYVLDLADGRAHLDPALRGSATLEQTLLEEKIREDWIRGTTNRRYPRWGKAAIASSASLGARLAKFHVVPPG
jgi:hypothetical protein